MCQIHLQLIHLKLILCIISGQVTKSANLVGGPALFEVQWKKNCNLCKKKSVTLMSANDCQSEQIYFLHLNVYCTILIFLQSICLCVN